MTATERKQRPLYSGVLRYFPDALLEVAHCSWVGNEQHNPGEPLYWNRAKSTDEPDALARHLLEAGTLDTDGVRHSAKVAWRALALLQKEIEAERGAAQQPEKSPVTPEPEVNSPASGPYLRPIVEVGERFVLVEDHRDNAACGAKGWRGVVKGYSERDERSHGLGGYEVQYDHTFGTFWVNRSAVAPEGSL